VIDAMGSGLAKALRDRYLLERELGRGGMAVVYLAIDLKHDRKVALKVLYPELASTLGPERFLREIEIASHLQHPHILPLFDSGSTAGTLWYAMPYVEGESLRSRLGREGQLPLHEAHRISCEVAEALGYAHKQGVIHRDIKPENIMLSGSHALVADFGIARAIELTAEDRLTETGLVLGTPAYMSPEQVTTSGRIDGRSDIYALGCVTYEMLAGAPPFTGPTAQALMARHAVDPVPSLRTVRPSVPVALELAVMRALAKVPADRFASADEFARALVLDDRTVRTRGVSLTGKQAPILLGIAVTCAAVALGTWMLRGSNDPAIIPSAATIAVLPLTSASADTALIGLGRDLAVTISASLDGIGGIKTADRLNIATETADRSRPSTAEAAALSLKLGASSMVRGTLVRTGENVRLDVGLYGTEDLVPLADGIKVMGHRDSIGALTDSVTWALLKQVWQRGDPPSPSLQAVTTRSLPALRAFLHGERELSADHWDEATLAYGTSIAADSSFWLAHFRYALAKFWKEQPVEPEVLAALRSNRQVLPERERLLVDAFLTPDDSIGFRVARYRLVTQQFPDYWPGWFLYADILAHFGPFLGHDWSEGVEALRRVVALNPKTVPAWQHLLILTNGRDRAEASRAWARLTELGWPRSPLQELAFQLWTGIGQSGGVLTPELIPLADSLAAATTSATAQSFRLEAFPIRLIEWGFPAAQIDLNRRALRRAEGDPELATALYAGTAWAWAARGQWDSAVTTIGAVAGKNPGPTAGGIRSLAVESYTVAVFGAWLGAITAEVASRHRPAGDALARLGNEESRQWSRGKIAWLDGLLGYVRKNLRAIEAARQDAARSGSSQTDLIDRSLAAFSWALEGDRKRAGREMLALEEYWAERTGEPIADNAVQRLAGAEWLRQVGDRDNAIRLMGWHEAMQTGWGWVSAVALSGPGYLAWARLVESRGEFRRAEEYYRLFMRRYDKPMATQNHLVEEAKTALKRLRSEQ
jgi:TolB-like protein